MEAIEDENQGINSITLIQLSMIQILFYGKITSITLCMNMNLVALDWLKLAMNVMMRISEFSIANPRQNPPSKVKEAQIMREKSRLKWISW